MKALKNRLQAAWYVLTKKYYIVNAMNEDGLVKTRSRATQPMIEAYCPKLGRANKVANLKASKNHVTANNRYN